jgi:hypothetical protein
MNKDLTRDFPSVARAGGRIQGTTALLDGEIVAVDANGVPRFQALQHRSRHVPNRSSTTPSTYSSSLARTSRLVVVSGNSIHLASLRPRGGRS